MANYGVINDRSPHIVADLCETIALFEQSPVSRGDIESYIAMKGGEGLFRELNAGNDTETNERIQAFTEDAFQHLAYRQAAFGKWYPYVVEHDVIELREGYTDYHRVYASLLTQSRLKMFSKPQIAKFAAEFEALCREALPGLLPSWNVYHFGVGGRDRAEFGNKLKDSLKALASKTREETIDRRIDEISDHNVGDAGIDIVAIYNWKDAADSVPTFFCQCAAQQEGWPEKRFEASPFSLEKYFSFFHKPSTVLFIPLCYRVPNGQWIGSDGHQSILIDRLRITELFDLQIDNGTKDLAVILATIGQPIEPGAFLLHEAIDQAA